MTRPSPQRLSLLSRMLRDKGIERSRRDVLARRGDFGDAPLSFEQVRMWFLDQHDPGNPRYNECAAARVGAALDPGALEAAAARVVERHEALRTWFVTSPSGRPVQRVTPSVRVPLRVEDLRQLPAGEREPRLAALVREEARRPFYLDQAPLFRLALARLADDESELVLTMHQMVADTDSTRIFLEELARFYGRAAGGEELDAPTLPLQYGDFAHWERETLVEAEIQRELAWWRERLSGLPRLELPTDHPRPDVRAGRGALLHRYLPADLVGRLRAFCRERGATPHSVLLAGYLALLHRESGQVDFAVGCATSCRDRVELEGLIGHFLRTRVLRADLRHDPTFAELVERAAAATLDAKRHEAAPHDRVVQVVRRAGRFGEPLIQAWFGHLPWHSGAPRIAGAEADVRLVDGERSRFELSLVVDEREHGIEARFEFDVDLFAPARVAGWADAYVALLSCGLEAPGTRLDALGSAVLAEARRPVQPPFDASGLSVDGRKVS